MLRAIIATVAILSSLTSVHSHTLSGQSTCADVIASAPSTAQPSHDTLHEAVWSNDAQSVCLLLQQHGADVNQRSDKCVMCAVAEVSEHRGWLAVACESCSI